jgi:hypothetical protein
LQGKAEGAILHMYLPAVVHATLANQPRGPSVAAWS